MTLSRAVLPAAIVLSIAVPAAGQTGWTRIGRTELSGDAARTTIAARDQQGFREIMLCIEGHALKIEEGVIHFRDNHSQPLRMRERIAADRCSRAVSLTGREKDINTIDVAYDPASLQGSRVKMELFAR